MKNGKNTKDSQPDKSVASSTQPQPVLKTASLMESPKTKKIIFIIVAVLAAGLIFFAGFFAGGKTTGRKLAKDGRPAAWAAREQGGQPGQMPGKVAGQKMGGGPRMIGEITAINGDQLAIKTEDQDLSVALTADTAIYQDGKVVSKTDLKTGETIVIFGAANSSGTVTAKTIRINN